MWQNYLTSCDAAVNLKRTKTGRVDSACEAIEFSRTLEDSDFFVAYTEFSRKNTATIDQMARFVDLFANIISFLDWLIEH